MTCIEIVSAAILSLHPNWEAERIESYADPICEASKKWEIDPLLPVAIIQHENSRWEHDDIYYNRNGSKDHGLMQFNCPVVPEERGWRRNWCEPKGRRKLLTIRGGIHAGVRVLSQKRARCLKVHKDTYYLYKTFIIYRLYNLLVCRDCPLTPIVFKYISFYPYDANILLKRKKHWWVQHYNWNSKGYGLRALFVYVGLKTKRPGIYNIIKRRQYKKLFEDGVLGRCMMRSDFCLEEIKKWQTKRRKTSRRKSKS